MRERRREEREDERRSGTEEDEDWGGGGGESLQTHGQLNKAKMSDCMTFPTFFS